jgi:hypothetical protein
MAYCRHLADFPPKDELEPLIDFIRSPQLHPPGTRSLGGVLISVRAFLNSSKKAFGSQELRRSMKSPISDSLEIPASATIAMDRSVDLNAGLRFPNGPPRHARVRLD